MTDTPNKIRLSSDDDFTNVASLVVVDSGEWFTVTMEFSHGEVELRVTDLKMKLLNQWLTKRLSS